MKMFSFPPPFPLRRFCNYSPDALRPPDALCRVQKRLLFWPLSIFAPFRQIQPVLSLVYIYFICIVLSIYYHFTYIYRSIDSFKKLLKSSKPGRSWQSHCLQQCLKIAADWWWWYLMFVLHLKYTDGTMKAWCVHVQTERCLGVLMHVHGSACLSGYM